MPPPRIDEHLQLLTDMIGDAVIVATTDGRVISCNHAACRLFGYSREELMRLHRRDLTEPKDPRVAELVHRREREGFYRGGLTLVRRGGERFEAETTSVIVEFAGAEPQVWMVLHDLADRQRAEAALAALRESNELLRALTDAAFEAVLVHREGVILLANRAAEVAAGVAPGALVGRTLFDFIAPQSHELSRAKVNARDEQPYESFGQRADGTIYPLEVRVRNAPVNVGGEPARVVALRDLSAQRQLEEQFRQAQKMDAVGRLAGGIAHDFNNLLSVIMNATTLAADALEPGHESLSELDEVSRAAERAAELTGQLLAFSRKQVLRTKIVDANAVVRGMASMFERLIGEDIEVVVRTSETVSPIEADPAQLELMLMNLIVNARQAMPRGGKLTIESRDVLLDEAYVRTHLETSIGPNVMIAVSDSGEGMDEATKARIFEPFFTTKAPGQGTGLGLSTVFGIVKQSGGSIWVNSEPGRGTTFKIYFPRKAEQPSAEQRASARSVTPRPPSSAKQRTVLLVEDDNQVRRVMRLMLNSAGYDVLDAAGPTPALEIGRNHQGVIDLLVTDIVMPEMSGKEIADQLASFRPEMRLLFISGYTEDEVVRHAVLEHGRNFLAKPFTRAALLAALTRILG